jgi:uncharacterized membrane protein YhiD involved in acid resistance
MDWLFSSAADAQQHAIVVAARLLAAWLGGAGVAAIYRLTRHKDQLAPSLPGTLVLLAVLIAMVTQVIGDNIARAFSLVGALSIVRFRTVVRDTQDTAYVIYAVAVGMAVGAGYTVVALLGFGITAAAAFSMRRPVTRDGLSCELDIRAALAVQPADVLDPILRHHARRSALTAVGTSRQGLSLELSYSIELQSSGEAEPLIRALNRTEGIQDVRLRRASPPAD